MNVSILYIHIYIYHMIHRIWHRIGCRGPYLAAGKKTIEYLPTSCKVTNVIQQIKMNTFMLRFFRSSFWWYQQEYNRLNCCLVVRATSTWDPELTDTADTSLLCKKSRSIRIPSYTTTLQKVHPQFVFSTIISQILNQSKFKSKS